MISYTEKKKNIKILVMDIDGTLTDGKLYIGPNGEVMKAFNVKDGFGIKDMLPQYNIIPVIITGRQSEIAEIRCKELGIELLYQGVKKKREFLEKLLTSMQLTYDNVAYIGDDILDLECIQKSALSGCPRNSAEKILQASDFIAVNNGGDGAVREFIEWIIER